MSLFDCAVCGEPGQLCSSCRVDAYCGKQHQKQDWPRHRAGCGSVKLEGGRLRAAKDIAKGTVLIKEGPVVVFPIPKWLNRTVCVGCCLEMEPTAGPRTSQCVACGLPACSEQCAKTVQHQGECGVFQRARFRMRKRDLDRSREVWPLAVAALRFALAARRDPRLASLPTDLTFGRDELRVRPDARTVVMAKGMAYAMSHQRDDDHAKERSLRKLGVRAVKWLRRTVGVTWLSEQELQHAATIIELLGHSAYHNRPAEREWSQGRLFHGYSQLEHSCVPNTAFLNWKGSENPAQEHVVVAARDIPAGEYLTKDFMHVGWMENTMERQFTLVREFGIICRCKRCDDPTELGEYVGSPLCPACAKKGERHYIVVSADPDIWECLGCEKKTSLPELADLLTGPSKLLKKLSGDKCADCRLRGTKSDGN